MCALLLDSCQKFEDEEDFLWLTEQKLVRLTEHETLSKASALLSASPITCTPNVTYTDRILTLLGRILQRDNQCWEGYF